MPKNGGSLLLLVWLFGKGIYGSLVQLTLCTPELFHVSPVAGEVIWRPTRKYQHKTQEKGVKFIIPNTLRGKANKVAAMKDFIFLKIGIVKTG